MVPFDPLNEVGASVLFLSKADSECLSENFRLIILVKSKPDNFEKRQVIRNTWGYQKKIFRCTDKNCFFNWKL